MERTWRNFRRRRCCALCPGYGFVAPVSAAPPGRHTGTLAGRQKRKKPIRQDGLFTCLMPGSSLLSHGETPHYHRRYGVSLLSSAWGQVGPTALVPPGKFFVLVLCLLRSYCVGCSRECQSHTYVCSFHRVVCRLVSAQNPSDSESELKILSNRQNIFGVVRLSLTVH